MKKAKLFAFSGPFVFILAGALTSTHKKHWSVETVRTAVESTQNHVYPLPRNKGLFCAPDNTGSIVLFEWERVAVYSPAFLEKMRSLSGVMARAFAPIETQFLQKYPDSAGNYDYFKPVEQIVKKHSRRINWKHIEHRILPEIKKYAEGEYPQGIFKSDAQSWFITVREPGSPLPVGFALFITNSDFSPDSAYLEYLAFVPTAQHRGLGKLTASALFRIIDPTPKRIFLYVRPTNESAQKAYLHYGFSVDLANSADEWLCMELFTDKPTVLRAAAEQLKEV